MYLILCIGRYNKLNIFNLLVVHITSRSMVSSSEIMFGRSALMSSDVSSNAESRSDIEALNTLWCSVLIPGFLRDKETCQSWSSVSGFRVEGSQPDHKALMLNTTANSCNNCINSFIHIWLRRNSHSMKQGNPFLTTILINYFALVGQMRLSPAHVIPGIEKSPDEVFQIIILLWPLLCFSTDTAEISQFKCRCI